MKHKFIISMIDGTVITFENKGDVKEVLNNIFAEKAFMVDSKIFINSKHILTVKVEDLF